MSRTQQFEKYQASQSNEFVSVADSSSGESDEEVIAPAVPQTQGVKRQKKEKPVVVSNSLIICNLLVFINSNFSMI